MDRRTFAKSCLFCVAGATFAPLLGGCRPTYYVTGTMEADGLSLLKSEFSYLKNDVPALREYVIVKNDALDFPLYVYRFSENEYTALLMKCTHQGNELQAAGDHLHCNAHGSEFNNRGRVVQGPAEKNLRQFKVRTEAEKIFIDLRA